MNRRSVLITTAALSLVALPSAAMAYEAPGVTVAVTDATPALGAPVSVTISGAQPNELVGLTVTSDPISLPNDSISIAGTKSLGKAADANGVVVFQVSFSSAGVFTAQAEGTASGLLATQVLTAAAPGAAAPAATATSSGALAITGSEATTLAIGAGALLAVGAGAVVVTRRRKASQNG